MYCKYFFRFVCKISFRCGLDDPENHVGRHASLNGCLWLCRERESELSILLETSYFANGWSICWNKAFVPSTALTSVSLQVAALVVFGALVAINVLLNGNLSNLRSELVQTHKGESQDSYLGELWRTRSDSENILGSLAMTRSVGQRSIRQHSNPGDKVFVSLLDEAF